MNSDDKRTIQGFHYTNIEAYLSMRSKGVKGYYTSGFDEFTGLIPQHKFLRIGRGHKLPEAAHDGVIEGLLEPEPTSWIHNEEHPIQWSCLFHDICRSPHIVLLSFNMKRSDEAYVVDRAHIERELYREWNGYGPSTRRTMNIAARKYWNSRVHVLDYQGNYQMPQLAIWSGIELERLRIEWIRPRQEVWVRVCKNEDLWIEQVKLLDQKKGRKRVFEEATSA